MPTYTLRHRRLLAAASEQGDTSRYAISKRTGIAQSTLSRLFRGIGQPATQTLAVLAATYGVDLDELIEAAPEEVSA